MGNETERQLKIKVGSVKRTKKEYDFYLKEEQKQRAHISSMEAANSDKHDMKQQVECLNETLTVLPDALGRLERYAIELKKFLEEHYDVDDIIEGEKGNEKSSSPDDIPPEELQVKESLQLLRELTVALPQLQLLEN